MSHLNTTKDRNRPDNAYQGSCHCGTIFFTLTIPSLTDPTPREVVLCNCTNCTQHGVVLTHSHRINLKFSRGADRLKGYAYASGEYLLRWCGDCGVVIGYLKTGDGEPTEGEWMSVNVRTLHGLDYDALPKKKFDQINLGKPWVQPTE